MVRVGAAMVFWRTTVRVLSAGKSGVEGVVAGADRFQLQLLSDGSASIGLSAIGISSIVQSVRRRLDKTQSRTDSIQAEPRCLRLAGVVSDGYDDLASMNERRRVHLLLGLIRRRNDLGADRYPGAKGLKGSESRLGVSFEIHEAPGLTISNELDFLVHELPHKGNVGPFVEKRQRVLDQTNREGHRVGRAVVPVTIVHIESVRLSGWGY